MDRAAGLERPWTRAAPDASRGGRAMSQAALSHTQQQLLPQVGGGATLERRHCLAHSTRLQLHDAHTRHGGQLTADGEG